MRILRNIGDRALNVIPYAAITTALVLVLGFSAYSFKNKVERRGLESQLIPLLDTGNKTISEQEAAPVYQRSKVEMPSRYNEKEPFKGLTNDQLQFFIDYRTNLSN